MTKKDRVDSNVGGGGTLIRFDPRGLAVFSVVLVLAGGCLGFALVSFRVRGLAWLGGHSSVAEGGGHPATGPEAACGELAENDIWIERPEEYIGLEVKTNLAPEWFFDKRSPAEVRQLMLSCGLNSSEIDRVMTPPNIFASPEGTTVKPEDEMVFSLTPQTRAALYREQTRNQTNRYISAPFVFQGENPEEWFAGSNLDPSVLAQVRKLIYPRGEVQCFSDIELMMRSLPSEPERLALIKALSRQPALLVRLRVRPTTDLDKVIGYWSRGLQVRDARPLLESLKRLPDGGSISLLYLLPLFARERLYTFPNTPLPGQAGVDCHWSSMNYFNDPPDNRFSDPDYTVEYIKKNYYPLAKPTLHGDIVLVVKGGTEIVHSAVYLAQDIVFTKNGNNIQQPWTLMRMKDLLGQYEKGGSLALSFYRHNNW